MTNSLLVAHDFSDCAAAAAREALSEAERTGAELIVLHVHPLVPSSLDGGGGLFVPERDVVRESRAELEGVGAALRAAAPSVRVTTVFQEGDPIQVVLAEAKRAGAARIFVGTHGRRGLAHLVLGSVAEQIVRDADRPVVVVKAGAALSR